MLENINKTHGVIFSQRVMLKLIEKGFVREQAYYLVQPKSNASLGKSSIIPSIIRSR